jgi:RND family efflux transporter MFP subunit
VEKGTVLFRLDDRTETQALLAAEARLALWSGDRADVAERKQAEAAVAMARTQLERRAVRAPFRGTIDHYDIDVGEFASPGRTLARLLDLKRLYVDVHVLQEEVSRLQLGLSVAIRFPQLDSNSRKATVVRIAAASLRGESRYLVELDLDEVSGVRPGFVATVAMPLMDSQSEITIPRDAIFQRFGTDRVFVVVRTGQADIVRETVIETRERVGRPDLAEVLSGLEVGDQVVTRGRLGLSDGAAVEVEGR